MRAHYFQHVPFEGLGSIKPWLQNSGYAITHTPFFASSALPAIDEITFLIVMGGPMSVNEEADYKDLGSCPFVRLICNLFIKFCGINDKPLVGSFRYFVDAVIGGNRKDQSATVYFL